MSESKTTPADENHPHSIFGASGARQWRTCPGSVNAIQKAKAAGKIPQRQDSEFSTEGTEAHDWADKVLTGKITIKDVPEKFRIHLEGYVAHCQFIANEALATGGLVFNERSVKLFYRPEDIGTLDFGALYYDNGGKPSKIDFTDLKYGVGVKVDAKENDQQMIYLLSLIGDMEHEEGEEFPDDLEVSISIYQPRHHSFDGEADTWETNLRDLKDYSIDIEADYRLAKDGDETMLNPSSGGCQFCDLKSLCPARAAKAIDPFVDFENGEMSLIDFNEGGTLSPETVAFIIENKSTITKTIADIEKGEYARLEQGGEPQGVKLVEGKLGPKKWVDEEAAETFLKSQLSVDERYQPRKLISAPQAFGKLKTTKEELSTIAKAKLGLLDEDEAKRTKTKCLFHREIAKPQMVSVDDPRPALDFTPVIDDFDSAPDTGDENLDLLM